MNETHPALSQKELSPKEQGIITIAAFTATGNMEQLNAALNEGLDAGLSVNEIKEVLVQMYAYAGFPRSLNGLGAFMSVLKARAANGVQDEIGEEATPLPAEQTSLELGTKVQTTLAGAPVTGDLYTFAPTIDQFLKSHLFGDIFGRDVLDYRSREIATLAALSSMPGVNAQLTAHFGLGMNTGLTEAQLESLVAVVRARVGAEEGDNASAVLESFLARQTH